jgi:hypothetical protein
MPRVTRQPAPIGLAQEVHGAVVGEAADGNSYGVVGVNSYDNALGYLGGNDQQSGEHVGVYGESDQRGVVGVGHLGIFGQTTTGVAVAGTSLSDAGVAARFTGKVELLGPVEALSHPVTVGTLEAIEDIRLRAADCAEEFDIAPTADLVSGTVLVLNSDGTLRPSDTPYDKRVVGVVSGAGAYRPGLILDHNSTGHRRLPVAMIGKVCCYVDATYAPVDAGDLLTSSPTEGYAMKATDQSRAFGAVLGKALQALPRGRALTPILVALQ